MTQDDSSVLITGGTRGLGRMTAKLLRAAGARVLITGTRQETTERAASELGVTGFGLDLASPPSVDHAVERLSGLPGIGCLIANAGLQVTRPETTPDGIELTFAVNHLGHLALIDGLRRADLLPRRIVLVSSATHDPARHTFMPRPLPAEVDLLREPPARSGAECLRRYTSSKLAAVMTTYELARRLPRTTVLAFDPGLIPGTGLARGYPLVARLAWFTIARAAVLLPFGSTVSRAARQLAELGDVRSSARSDVPSGSYLSHGRITRSSAASYDEAAQRRLVEDSLRLIASRRSDPVGFSPGSG